MDCVCGVCYNIDIGTLGTWFVSGRVLGVVFGV